ncbi:MAG: MoxR family ATPase [Candidatus Aenigmatarchaeota archaeon]|nr:MAG: MoxR family ATPase [Candidatus Aenigmarchaeota archaeon]
MTREIMSTQLAVKVDHKELKEIIKLYYRAKKALFIWGPPGIGKSATVRQAAQELAQEMNLKYSEDIEHINNEEYFIVLDIRLSQLDPSDLRGLPVFNQEKKVTQWLPPEFFPRKGKGIIFCDELNLAPPLVQGSAYQLILDRRLGSYKVPEGFSLIAAGNRLEDKANVFKMARPLENRFGHVELIKSVELWTEWALKNGISPDIVGFIQFRSKLLFQFDPNNKSAAQPTPRTWHFASDLLKQLPKNASLELKRKVVASVVGEGPATEFINFLRLRNELKPVDYYLKNPEKCELPDETRIDVLWALLTSIVEWYRDHKTNENLRKIVKLLNRVREEYEVFTLRMMAAEDPQLLKRFLVIPEGTELAKKLRKFLSAY